MEIKNRVCTFLELKESYSSYITLPEDQQLIEKAYRFAEKKHSGQIRKSGDPYVSHCLYVAYILSKLQVGPKTIAVGLLHDTIEDTDTTFDEIVENFGLEIATMTEALTKVTRLSDYKNVEFTAENHRKIFVAMAKDIRVILIKLADRLHNMMTLQYQPKEKQQRISHETLEVYAPIAHRLGLYSISTMLEDLSLYYLEPDKVKEIEDKCNQLVSDSKETLKELTEHIDSILSSTSIPYEISSRVKSVYSIYKKMYLKNYSFDQIYDILALRIITESEQNCYEILGYIHANFRPMPGRFKDYIAMPKTNMYQSLHTTIMTENGIFFEIQIRTKKMDELAESGVAAHWRYKEGSSYDAKREQMEIENQLQWFKEFVTISDSSNSDAKEYMDTLSHDIFDANVYVFTPKGNVICLPNGSTPIDFAYRIHTDLGEHLSGAKINGVLSPISTVLKTGDVVEVITAKNAYPNSEWMNIAKSHFAKSSIRKYLVKKNQDFAKEDSIKKGRTMLLDYMKDHHVETDVSKLLSKKMLAELKVNSADELFLQLSGKTISLSSIIDKFEVMNKKEEGIQDKLVDNSSDISTKNRLKRNTTDSIVLENGDNVLISLANCCQPLPGDEIIGYVSTGQGVKVHRADCPNIKKLDSSARLINVKWNPDNLKKLDYQVSLAVECHDRNQLLVDILNTLQLCNAKLIKCTAKQNTTNNTATISVDMLVKDKEILDHYIAALYKVKSVFNIRRIGK